MDDIAEFSKGSGYSKGDLIESGTPIILYGRLYTKYETRISDIDTFVEAKDGSVYSKGKTPRAKKIKYLNQFELHTLIANLELKENANWDWFILLVAKTGMRFSEALAITPADSDFARQTLSISKNWDYKGEYAGNVLLVGVNYNKKTKLHECMIEEYKF